MRRAVLLCLFISSTFGTNVGSINTTNGRIIGGVPADEGEYPAQVSISFKEQHVCGGSIVNENYVLTAAHCVNGRPASVMFVKVGTNNIQEGGVTHDVEEITLHSGFIPGDFSSDDIALFKVTTPFEFNDLVQPVTLPEQNLETPGGSDAMVIGWGMTSVGNGSASADLLEVEQQIRDHQECYDIYEEDVHITDAQICADVPEGGRGVCGGDSGGPLYVNGTIVGVASWIAKGCAVQGYPAVYTRVASYIDWINQQAK